MSSGRRSRHSSRSSSFNGDDQMNNLLLKLHHLLPQLTNPPSNNKVSSTSRVLEETCEYIRSLKREVDDLSERLTTLLSTSEMGSAEAAIITSLISSHQ